MRHLLILTFVFLIATPLVHGQKIEETINKPPQGQYEMYFQKHKKNKTAGWITFGAGLTMSVIGLATQTSGPLLSDNPDKGVGLIYAGGAVALLSTPFFIASGKNKRKANLALKNESLSFLNIKYKQSNYLALSVSIPF